MESFKFMMKITIICLGKFKEKAYVELEKEYLKRLSPFAKVKVFELPEEPYRKNADLDLTRKKEAEAIEKILPKNSIVILMDEDGTLRDSQDFATNIERLTSLGQELVFVIGSGIGLHESLKAVSNYTFSLSKLTFPHNLARILLLEQIYRSCMINSGKEYHKE